MASHSVALDADAYALLRRHKRGEESFSDVVKRLARPRRPLTEFVGMWKDLSARERAEMDHVYEAIRKADQRRSERIRKAWAAVP
jgi:predicted CopG family antitoxin